MTSEVKTTPSLNTSGIVDGSYIDAADVLNPFNDVITVTNKAQQYVSVSATDTYVKHLGDAIVAGSGIGVSTLNPTGNAQLSIAVGTLPVLNVSAAAPVSTVEATGGMNTFLFDAYNSSTLGVLLIGRHARGTKASPTATSSGDELFRFESRGYYTGGFAGNQNAALTFVAEENFTSTAQGSSIYLSTTPIGGAVASQKLYINGSGVIKSTYVDGITNNVVSTLNIYRTNGATSVAGFGVGLEQRADTNGFGERTLLRLSSWLTTAADASRATRGAIEMLDNGATRTPIAFGANGTASILGFHGTAPVVKPTVTGSKAANAALTSLLTALAGYGLITDSST